MSVIVGSRTDLYIEKIALASKHSKTMGHLGHRGPYSDVGWKGELDGQGGQGGRWKGIPNCIAKVFKGNFTLLSASRAWQGKQEVPNTGRPVHRSKTSITADQGPVG